MTEPTEIVPLAYPIVDAVKVSGQSKSQLYRAIRGGKITARKHGRSTLIERSELERWISSWPTIGRQPPEQSAAA